MNSLVYAVAAAILLTGGASAQSGEKRVLVYTRQTATAARSYIHDNTASSVAAIGKMGAENGFTRIESLAAPTGGDAAGTVPR